MGQEANGTTTAGLGWHMDIREVFERVPRARFLPPDMTRYWRLDRPLALPHGQTNSQPSTVRAMLRLLDVARGQRVLDVGAGSGWTTALLAELVGDEGRVIGVERIPLLADGAREALGEDWPWAEVRLDGAELGAPADGPFDRILVSAMAGEVPQPLVDQLADGGVLVVPVDGVMLRAVKSTDGLAVTEHGYYSFVPLIVE